MSASPGLISTHHTSYSSSGLPSGRAAATRLDDAISQLKGLKEKQGSGSAYQTHVSSPAKGPVLSPRSITSMNAQGVYPGNNAFDNRHLPPNGTTSQAMSYRSVSLSSAPVGESLRSPPPTAKKPAIPPQLRKSSNSPTTKVSPASSRSSSSGYTDGVKPQSNSVVLDAQGRCTCCPFGYHVDIDFVNFSQDVQSPTSSFTRPPRKPRLSFDSQSSPRSHSGVTPSSSLFLDEVEGNVKPVSVDVTHQPAYRTQSSSTPITSVDVSHRSSSNGQLTKSESNETIDSMMNFSSNEMRTTRRTVTSTQLAETMATHLPDHAGRKVAFEGGAALTISADSVEQIKKHMALSLQRMQELEEQIKVIPLMQERISRLKSDKKHLAQQLTNRSGVSCMRSIGVGDYDVEEEQTRIEKVIQTVVQEPPRKPTLSVGTGNYDVNVNYLTEAEAYHTLAEKVQMVREKEIQTWIEEGERQLAERRAAMRSCGVGDGDVFAEPETIKVKETEVKTVYIEPDKPEQRNVGLQVKPQVRDVCIFSQQEEKPLTRTCGFNVDVNDLMQEMQLQNEEMERSEFGELQAGQKNAWQMQKHVIQRKFMEAMHKGTQKDLVVFITGLLKRSVKSVGTTVKPVSTDFGMTTTSGHRGRDVGVGDDSVNVQVRPHVMTRDNFCSAKPVTRTQPTWTDLILTCDSATNTQQTLPSHLPLVSTTLELRPVNRYKVVQELYTARPEQQTPSRTREQQIYSTGREDSPLTYTSTKTITTRQINTAAENSGSSVSGGTSSSARGSSARGNSVSSSSVTGSSVSGSSVNGSSVSGSSVSGSSVSGSSASGGSSYSGSTSGGRRDSRTVTDISREYVDELLSTAEDSDMVTSRDNSRSPGEVSPQHFIEQRVREDDSGVSEVIRQVTSAPGVREQTIKVNKSHGGLTSQTMQSTSQQHRTLSDSESLLGSNFHQHKADMMKHLRDEQQSQGPISVEISVSAPLTADSVSVTSTKTSSGLSSSHEAHGVGNSVSPRGVLIEREGQAQRRYDEEMKRKGQTSGGAMSRSSAGGSFTSRQVQSSSGVHGDYTEVVEERELSDGNVKETVIEKSFTSSSSREPSFQTKFPNFSDYFARGEPPKGRSERMMAYDGSTYQSTSTPEVERNKSEMSGDPLKARYTVEDMSSLTLSTQRSSLTSEESSASKSPRSIMKKDSASPGFNRNISFAEEAEVAEVVEEQTERPARETEGFSDEEESEVSFEEGTYDGRHGDISFHCETDKSSTASHMAKAKSQEELDIDVELQAACSIVQQHIESGDTGTNSKMLEGSILASALSVIQQDWFKVASGQQANVKEIDGYMACFEDFSTELLEHVINMTDGNGNTVLHYAVSHCNFPTVSLLVDSGVADVNLQNKAGYTPIMLAALSEVACDEDRMVISQLLSKGNVNLAASQSETMSRQAGQTALMLAVSHGRLEMVRLLLEAGAEINLQDEDGSTALMCATEHGHMEIVKALLAHPDIDVSLKDNDGSTALEIALENSQKEIGMLLYAKDQSNKSSTAIKKRASRIPGSSASKGSQKSSRVVTVTRRRY